MFLNLSFIVRPIYILIIKDCAWNTQIFTVMLCYSVFLFKVTLDSNHLLYLTNQSVPADIV